MRTKTKIKTHSLSRAGKLIDLLYSVFCYLFFLLTFLYFIGFVGNVFVPKSLNSVQGMTWPLALSVDILLITLFAVQHSGMARKSFKAWWKNFIPPAIERATYVLVSSVVLALICWLWQPIDANVWRVESPLGRGLIIALFWLGWGTVLMATFLISHFELFGIKQALDALRQPKPSGCTLRTPMLYKIVRHPMYMGFLIAFWATPEMSVGHLVFALMSTIYILIGTHLEEKDLVLMFGKKYQRYQKNVGMLLPSLRPKSKSQD